MLLFAHGLKLKKKRDRPKRVDVFSQISLSSPLELERIDLEDSLSKRGDRKIDVNKCYKRVYLHMLS